MKAFFIIVMKPMVESDATVINCDNVCRPCLAPKAVSARIDATIAKPRDMKISLEIRVPIMINQPFIGSQVGKSSYKTFSAKSFFNLGKEDDGHPFGFLIKIYIGMYLCMDAQDYSTQLNVVSYALIM